LLGGLTGIIGSPLPVHAVTDAALGRGTADELNSLF
jgi:hypothetical protein